MSLPDLTRVLNSPGKLCYGPTDLSIAFPHGGTAIGSIYKCGVTHIDTRREIKDESMGSEVHDIIWCGENWALSAILREYNNEGISLLFNNSAPGGFTQRAVVSSPGSNRPGMLYSARAVVLLFSPLDADRLPAVIFYKAVPLPEESARMALAMSERLEIPAVFLALRDATNRIASWGLLKDLSL